MGPEVQAKYILISQLLFDGKVRPINQVNQTIWVAFITANEA